MAINVNKCQRYRVTEYHIQAIKADQNISVSSLQFLMTTQLSQPQIMTCSVLKNCHTIYVIVSLNGVDRQCF
jgi:hypothetical protein